MIATDELDKGIQNLQWLFHVRDTFNALREEIEDLKSRVEQLEGDEIAETPQTL
ncbi:MAG: hypothetical protein JSU70_17495 [Phycisphaerales bacterium]|nr:MAG: hypothetical protein JSU70_17495 [Phycisphaerales bacterium]